MLIEMKVAAIAEDEIFKTPIIVLKSIDSKQCLPIWVGSFEGQSIEYGIKGNSLLRPLPYDTTLRMLKFGGIEIEKVVINDFKSNTFYAIIVLNKDGSTLEIDSRPSDAIALAVRCGAPILVLDSIINESVSVHDIEEHEDIKKEDIKLDPRDKDYEKKRWLMKLDPKDF